jgi:hypothetical protein
MAAKKGGGRAGRLDEAIAFYFESAGSAHAFVARFCGYRIETIPGSFAVRRNETAPRCHGAAHKTP